VKKIRIVFVIQRYGLDVAGGAELHCRYICEKLKDDFDVTVLTTCAHDYITWENHYKPGEEIINGVKVIRFKVKRRRDPVKFGKYSNYIFRNAHKMADELEWLRLQGPYSPDLIKYLKKKEGEYDLFVFFSYRYYLSYWGIRSVPEKAFLVPTAEEDQAVKLKLYTEIFRNVQGIFYNSQEEKELIERNHGNFNVQNVVVGVGISETDGLEWEEVKERFKIEGDYILYIGRIDNNKGCDVLFRYFRYYARRYPGNLKLILAGKGVIKIPDDERISHLGFINESEKFGLIKNAVALVMPSRYESLSMVLLEAWSQSVPVLVNESCKVLKGQCLRSNGGLYYTGILEFAECLSLLNENRELSRILGRQGNNYYRENYNWVTIKRKYKDLIHAFLESS